MNSGRLGWSGSRNVRLCDVDDCRRVAVAVHVVRYGILGIVGQGPKDEIAVCKKHLNYQLTLNT